MLHRTVLTSLVCIGLIGTVRPAMSQGRSDNPNMRQFYMARQQWTITDDAPMVNDQRTTPAPGAAGGLGGMPAGPPLLPKAGWQPYSSQIPGIQTTLPKVNNGVPPKLPSAPNPVGLQGKSGSLKPKTPAAAVKPTGGPATIQSYNAYKGYGGSLLPSSGQGTSSGPGLQSQESVKGNVLKWARTKRSPY